MNTLSISAIFSIITAIKAGTSVNTLVTRATKSMNSAIRSFYYSRVNAPRNTAPSLAFAFNEGSTTHGRLSGDAAVIKSAQQALAIPFASFSLNSFSVADFAAAGFSLTVA